MKKTLIQIFCFFTLVLHCSTSVYAGNKAEKPFIISREVWQANSLYNDRGGQYWQDIFAARSQQSSNYSPSQAAVEKSRQKTKDIEEYLYGNFIDQFTSQETLYYHPDTGVRLAWPIKYTQNVNAIVVHHTHTEYESSLDGMQNIHKYHGLSRQWGDIGYNYVIGYDGEIFEGREGGKYAVGAHSTYNNFGTAGIAIMGNYDSEGISTEQYKSLEQLIRYLTEYYGIDLDNERYYHRTCSGSNCDTFHLETYLDSVLIGHRDATHTSCPGDELYEQIQQIRSANLAFTKGFTPKNRGESQEEQIQDSSYETALIHEFRKKLRKYNPETLILIQQKLDILSKKSDLDQKKQEVIQILRLAIMLESQD